MFDETTIIKSQYEMDVERARARDEVHISIKPTAITGGVTAPHSGVLHALESLSTCQIFIAVHLAVQDADVDP
jgi:hypothetical protein